MTSYLTPDELRRLTEAALETGLADPAVRPLLFDGIMPRYRGTLPLLPAPAHQVHSDLAAMNRVERLVDGSVPLEIWLRNATGQTFEAAPLALFQGALDTVARSAGGEPEFRPPVPDAELAEIKEQIIHRDDTVPFGFLRGGDRAGAAVARLKVYPYEGGEPRTPNGYPHAGTGWLVTPVLLVTNHHVVNARTSEGGTRPLAAEDDLRLQAKGARARFDYEKESADAGDDGPQETTIAELAAADADLDYAVLRLTEPSTHPVLRLARDPLTVRDGEIMAVNIIQHPGGQPKRVALRNNLVYATDERDVRYFTDTRGGSSGSPVLTDDWRVVALHRGTRRVEDVAFQGRETAFVNVGTQISQIMSHLATHSPQVHAEITQAQTGGP
ncbi:trypsin-like peptidase domain-containing protein [Streptomyces sp. NPDC057638]|uniref:trypsin-like peptidase domain-containing protein n=1 Tax=Streptomyces sp. NPDC057638 TaxID=3346190 RepID=UPI00368BD067